MKPGKVLNPILENYRHHETDEPITLDEYIKDEAEALGDEYIRKFGFSPSKEMVISWMQRLRQAYHRGIITGARYE